VIFLQWVGEWSAVMQWNEVLVSELRKATSTIVKIDILSSFLIITGSLVVEEG